MLSTVTRDVTCFSTTLTHGTNNAIIIIINSYERTQCSGLLQPSPLIIGPRIAPLTSPFFNRTLLVMHLPHAPNRFHLRFSSASRHCLLLGLSSVASFVCLRLRDAIVPPCCNAQECTSTFTPKIARRYDVKRAQGLSMDAALRWPMSMDAALTWPMWHPVRVNFHMGL